jgi:predicted CXXCH cytochrome family protein
MALIRKRVYFWKGYIAYLTFFLLLFIYPLTYIWGMEEHKCNDCHSAHVDNFSRTFITRSDTNFISLCLSCHGLSKAFAPKVLHLSPNVNPTLAGGYFPANLGPWDKGHDLGFPSTLKEEGLTLTLSCISCHDPHTNSNYRGLWADPLNASKTKGIEVRAKFISSNLGYQDKNIKYIKGINQWCSSCHWTKINSLPGRPSHHPVGVPLDSSPLIDASYFNSLIDHVPIEDPLDNTVHGPIPEGTSDDLVSCLSCHYAHGSNFPKSLRYADGSTLKSTCQQCHHNKIINTPLDLDEQLIK